MEVAYVPAVEQHILALPAPLVRRVQRMLALLKEHGSLLREPYSKALGDGLFELRVVGAIQVRLLYFYHQDKAIIVHSLIKKQQRLPLKDISFARKVKEMLIGI